MECGHVKSHRNNDPDISKLVYIVLGPIQIEKVGAHLFLLLASRYYSNWECLLQNMLVYEITLAPPRDCKALWCLICPTRLCWTSEWASAYNMLDVLQSIIFVSDFVVYLNFEIKVHLHALVPRTFYKLLWGKAVTLVVDHRYLLLWDCNVVVAEECSSITLFTTAIYWYHSACANSEVVYCTSESLDHSPLQEWCY